MHRNMNETFTHALFLSRDSVPSNDLTDDDDYGDDEL